MVGAHKSQYGPGLEFLGHSIGLSIPDSGPDAYRDIRGRFVPAGFAEFQGYR
jgi:hypothetical protein